MNITAPTNFDLDFSPIDFEVIRQPVYSRRNTFAFGDKYEEIENKFEYYRKDTGKTLGVHTGSYNHDGYANHMRNVMEAIVEMENQNKIDVADAKANFSVYEDGKKLKLDITFPRHILEPAIGDITKLRLRDWDSYDSSWGRRLTLDGFRLWCLNGCTSSAFKLNFYAKHTKSISSDESITRMLTNMQTMLITFQDDEEKFKRWINTKVEAKDAMGMFSKTIAFQPKAIKVDGEYFHHALRTMEDLEATLHNNRSQSGNNLYAVYNTATEWASHVGQSKGRVHNVERNRESKVASMLNSENWKRLETA